MDNLKTHHVADIAKCHFSTVKNYANKGVIAFSRDLNGHRRFSVKEAYKLRELLAMRIKVRG